MSNEFETIDTQLIFADGSTIPAKFHVWDADPEDQSMIRLELELPDRHLTRTDTDYFAALRAIRRELEKEGLRISCYGASKNVYPSNMSLSMGAGEKAYRLKLGEHANPSDIVFIFDRGPDVMPATIEEQDRFFEEWTKSIL